jgi:hypothetical protein
MIARAIAPKPKVLDDEVPVHLQHYAKASISALAQ